MGILRFRFGQDTLVTVRSGYRINNPHPILSKGETREGIASITPEKNLEATRSACFRSTQQSRGKAVR